MAKQYHPVDPEKIDYQQFLELAKSGNLYFVKYPKKSTMSRNERMNLILDYVARIHCYASADFAPYIADMWNEIVWDPRIFPKLFIVKGDNKGQINRYRILAYVNYLLNKGVYNESLVTLYQQLEENEGEDKYYHGSGSYAPVDPYSHWLDELCKKYKHKKMSAN